MVKTPAEIALMQAATDVTIAAYRWTYPRVEAGMTGADIAALMNAATRRLGGDPEFALALIGEASAYPHGSREVHRVANGQVVLMDCGCTVQGYQSDVSRTWVHGAATKGAARDVGSMSRAASGSAFAAARIGAAAGSVDDAVRRYYESLGLGPGYKLPGLSHRTGRRDRDGWARARQPGPRRGHPAGRGHVFLRRAGHLHSRPLRRAAGGLLPHDRRRRGMVQRTASFDRYTGMNAIEGSV